MIDVLLPDVTIVDESDRPTGPYLTLQKSITIESAVTGALELAFWQMVSIDCWIFLVIL